MVNLSTMQYTTLTGRPKKPAMAAPGGASEDLDYQQEVAAQAQAHQKELDRIAAEEKAALEKVQAGQALELKELDALKPTASATQQKATTPTGSPLKKEEVALAELDPREETSAAGIGSTVGFSPDLGFTGTDADATMEMGHSGPVPASSGSAPPVSGLDNLSLIGNVIGFSLGLLSPLAPISKGVEVSQKAEAFNIAQTTPSAPPRGTDPAELGLKGTDADAMAERGGGYDTGSGIAPGSNIGEYGSVVGYAGGGHEGMGGDPGLGPPSAASPSADPSSGPMGFGGAGDYGGCIIISACTNPYSYEVNVTRAYRDRFLNEDMLRGYYSLAKKVVPWINKYRGVKAAVKGLLVNRLIDYGEVALALKPKVKHSLSRPVSRGFLMLIEWLGRKQGGR